MTTPLAVQRRNGRCCLQERCEYLVRRRSGGQGKCPYLLTVEPPSGCLPFISSSAPGGSRGRGLPPAVEQVDHQPGGRCGVRFGGTKVPPASSALPKLLEGVDCVFVANCGRAGGEKKCSMEAWSASVLMGLSIVPTMKPWIHGGVGNPARERVEQGVLPPRLPEQL